MCAKQTKTKQKNLVFCRVYIKMASICFVVFQNDQYSKFIFENPEGQ